MARTGDTIENADTGGDVCRVETFLRPDAFVAAAHVHPQQEERFEVVSGTVGFRADGETVVLGAGETLTVPAGVAHRFWNAGDDEARFVCEVRPALRFEHLLETMFALAVDGRTNRKGLPNPLRLAVIAQAHFDIVRLPFPPVALQRAGLAVGAPLGRLLGYRPAYAPQAATGPRLRPQASG